MVAPVSQSAAKGAAQHNSCKKQRVGQAILLPQHEVDVTGRQNKTLSDTSDDNYLPDAAMSLLVASKAALLVF